MKLRDVLNRIFWNAAEKTEDYEVTFIHRGAPMDRRTIPFKAIKEVRSSWFVYSQSGEEDTLIPLHRVLEIKNLRSGRVLWSKKMTKSPELS